MAQRKTTRRKTKAQFIRSQRRKKRSKAQAEVTWKMMQAAKERFRSYYALNAKRKPRRNPKDKRILITYEIVTPESAEYGDAEERGWIDEEGDVIELDEFDREEGITVVDKTVAYLDSAYAYEPSESGREAAPRWWTDYEHEGDPATGARTNKSYHLEGYTEAEKRQIYRVMKQLHSWVP